MRIELDVPEAVLSEYLGSIEIPPMARVRQQIETPEAISDVAGTVRVEMRAANAPAMFPAGARVAIGVGSRGIGRLSDIVRGAVDELRSIGALPFIVPSMGSHGGATAEGQTAILHHLGVTERAVGAPIVSDMETQVVARTPDGMDVHMASAALRADGIVFVARVKPHTAFRGPYESGLAKMIAIGLGKQPGAASTHARGFGQMARMVPEMARAALQVAPIRLGIAVLENAHDMPYKIRAIPAGRILEEEPPLLVEARASMPRLPFDAIDVLVIDRIGKDISGDGADPNITGRYPTPYASGGPQVSKQVVLDLTEASGRNANGVGTADFTTARLARKMSLAVTYPNALTSTVPGPVALPMILPSDRLAIAAAILTCNSTVQPPRTVRIRDTLQVEEMWVSESLLSGELRGHVYVTKSPALLPFDRNGDLTDFAPETGHLAEPVPNLEDSW